MCQFRAKLKGFKHVAGREYYLWGLVLTGKLIKYAMGAKGSSMAKKGCNCGRGAAAEVEVVPLPTQFFIPPPLPPLPEPEPEVLKDLPASEMFGLAFTRLNEKRTEYGVPAVDLILGQATEAAFQNAIAIADAFKQTGCKRLTRTAEAQNIYAITLGGMTYDTSTLKELMAGAVDVWYEGGPGTLEFTQMLAANTGEVAFGVALADCGGGKSPWLIFIANFMPAPPVVG